MNKKTLVNNQLFTTEAPDLDDAIPSMRFSEEDYDEHILEIIECDEAETQQLAEKYYGW